MVIVVIIVIVVIVIFFITIAPSFVLTATNYTCSYMYKQLLVPMALCLVIVYLKNALS